MIKTITRTSLAALSFSVAAASAGGAFAQSTGEGFFDAFKRMMDLSGYEMGFKDITEDGESATANRVRLRLKNAAAMGELAGELDLPLDETGTLVLTEPLVAEGIVDVGDAYTAEKLYIPEFTVETDDVVVTVGELSYGGIRIPTDDISIEDLMKWVTSASFGPIDIVIEDIPAFYIAPITSQTDFEPSQAETLTKMTSTFSAPEITFFLENAPEPIEEPFDLIFGTSNITGQMDGTMEWTLDDGRMTISSYRMAADGLGQFEMSLDVSGITMDVMEEIMNLSEMDPEDPAMQAQVMELGMGMAARSFFHGFSVRYDDFGAADRFFSFVEEDEGMTRTEMADELLNEVREMFEDLELNAELEMVETAVTAFLEDPQNIELRIAPEQPLPFISFMGLIATPQVLSDTLNASLIANQ